MNNTVKPILLVGYFFLSSLLSPISYSSEVKRELIVLWSSAETQGKEYTAGTVHRNMESIFNYYGYKLKYVEVNYELKKLNFLKNIDQYAGIVSFFYDNKIKDTEDYIQFLNTVIEKQVPLIVLGEWGFFSKDYKKNKSLIDQFFKKLEIKVSDSYYDNPLLFKVISKSERVEFERKLENEILRVQMITNLGPKNRAQLRIEVKGEDFPADVVILNEKKFFYAQRGFELFDNPYNEKTQWRIDPFYYFDKVLEQRGPIPDVTTINGSRTAFFHIDGDGFINASEVDRTKMSGDIIINEIIKKYALPTTASVVTSEIDSKYFGSKKSENLVRELFRNPIVEAASHTFSHPLSWSMEPDQHDIEAYIDDRDVKKHKGPILAYKIKSYNLDYYKEVVESVSYIDQNYLSKNKKTQLVQWSGNCLPPEIAVKLVEEESLGHINGGDSRFDKTFNSYSGLSGLYRQIGKYIQVYSGAANENIYTNLWKGPFNGFINVIDNFKNTDKPKRIKPINIYYHFYSGEKVSSLAALKSIYEWVLNQEINPIFTSEYVKIVHGFASTTINKLNDKHFKVSNNGNLRTLRFDHTKLIPDYVVSKNVIGHKYINDNLYVFLGGDVSTEIVLTDEKQTTTYIESCNCSIDQIRQNGKNFYVTGKTNVPLKLKLSTGQEVVRSRGSFKDMKVKL